MVGIAYLVSGCQYRTRTSVLFEALSVRGNQRVHEAAVAGFL